MLPFLCNSTRGKHSLLGLAQLLFVTLCLHCIYGATLREHRLRESESEPQQSPNADMIKALEYIESLRQRTDTQEKPLLPNADRHLDDAQKTHATLRLAPDPIHADNDGDNTDEERSEDKSEELLQAVLSTLQQTEKASKPTLPRPSSLAGADRKSGGYAKVPEQRGIMPHKKMPLMFEEDEEGEGDEEEGEDDHENPFKRTNENVEEKYTPQNLATLQSVFDELDKFTNQKMTNKRQEEDDDAQDEEEEEGEDLFNLRNVVYDDEGEDLTDWGPGEQGEDEEEEEEDKHQLDRSLDYVDDEEEQDEDERYPVRRSNDPDQVDYYLLKVLERTEEEEQKRAIEEEENKRAERRVTQYRDNIDPRVIYQLIQISRKYQIPPEDLLDMLKTGETTSQWKAQESRDKNKLWKTSSKKIYKIPQTKFYSRRLPVRKNSPKNLQREAILNILGLGNAQNRDPTPVWKPYRSPASRLHALTAGRPGDDAPTQRRFPPSKSKDDDDTTDGELAAYLASQMLARYPGPAYHYGKAGQKRDEAGQNPADSFEQAMQDYLDQMDSNKVLNKKRQSEDGERGFDNEAVMKLMSYFNPESEDSESEAKAENGI
ncbi:secretogranin-2a [Syngnathus scovelli]|uniref:secretogranin-2a n=1 Tax=Syngnathus scovelli TaxID=161590 RepID=UPI0021100672|nr:secretogranin-2 [Syngnathus scovelli]